MSTDLVTLRQFFDEDNSMASKAIVRAIDTGEHIPGSVFINLEQNGISALYRQNIIDVLARLLLPITDDAAAMIRLITQLQFVISLKPN